MPGTETTVGQRRLNEGVCPRGVAFGDKMKACLDLIRELHDDHATSKTGVDQTETLIEELHDDHATFRTNASQTEALVEELHDDHASFRTTANNLKTYLGTRSLAAAGLKQGVTTKSAIAMSATVFNGGKIPFIIGGRFYSKAPASAISFSNVNDRIPASGGVRSVFYGIGLNTAGTVRVTRGTIVAGSAGGTRPATPATFAPLGFMKMIATSGTVFSAGKQTLTAAGLTPSFENWSFLLDDVADPPATLTASKPASPPATLSAPKPASGPATLTASKPDALA